MTTIIGEDGYYLRNEDGEIVAGPFLTKDEALGHYRKEYLFFA